MREELGLETDKWERVGEFKPDTEKGLVCFGEVYIAKVDRNVSLNFDPNEVMELKWMSVMEVRKLLASVPEKFKRDFGPVFEMVFGQTDLVV